MKASIKKIVEALFSQAKVAIFLHVNMDGDALGSALALASALSQKKIKVKVFIEEECPDSIKVLFNYFPKSLVTKDSKYTGDYAGVLIDCNNKSRIPDQSIPIFEKAKVKFVIDHHTSKGENYDFTYVDSKKIANSEIVYEILLEASRKKRIKLTTEIATALYLGIVSDSGRFMFKNVSEKTHKIASHLIRLKADKDIVMTNLYQEVPFKLIMLEQDVMGTIKTYYNDKLIIAYVNNKMLKNRNMHIKDVEHIIPKLKSIKGVFVACLIKETPKEIKVTLRSKTKFNVASFAESYGGGGHKAAAGYTSSKKTIKATIDEILADRRWEKLKEK